MFKKPALIAINMTEKFQINEFKGYGNYRHARIVNTDDYSIGRYQDLIGAEGVATCLVITLYDIMHRRGALGHIAGLDRSLEELQPDRILDTLLSELFGFEKIDYNMLEATISGEGFIDSGQKMAPIVRSSLKDYNIPIIGEDLNQEKRRLVFLHCDTGSVDVLRE